MRKLTSKHNKTHILFRADGNSKIGLGHVMRSLALAEMIGEDFKTIFVIKNPEIKLAETIRQTCDELVDISDESEFIDMLKPDELVVIDGYQFKGSYQKEIKKKAKALIAIDDKADLHFYSDLIINHGSAGINYDKEPYTKILYGSKYLLARKPFLNAAKQSRKVTTANSLFICLGGADPFNHTIKILKAGLACDHINTIHLVVGSAYKFDSELDAISKNISIQKKIVKHQNLDAVKMVEIMRQCNIAVSSASSISLELCCVKIGLLIGTVADNQSEINKLLEENGCAISCGDLNIKTEEEIIGYLKKLQDVFLINNMIQKQKKLFDGLSAERIKGLFLKLVS